MAAAKRKVQKPEIKFLVSDVDGVLTDGGIYITDDGGVFKKFNVKDGVGISRVIKKGIIVGFISAGKKSENLLKHRAEMLGVKHYYSGDNDKLEVLKKWCKQLKISLNEAAYIGDDVIDLKIISAVGFSACPADAVDKIKKAVDVVLDRKGGDACVREFIERFILPV